MDIRQLEYCLAVAQWGNFTKAADDLFITRQALSKAVHNLELELGETLFVNHDGSLKVTDAGRAFFRDAQPVVDAYHELARRYTGGPHAAERVRGLSVALVPGAALTLPPGIIDRFSEEHSSVLLSIENAPTEVALDMVASGESEIALVGSAPEYLANFDASLVVRTSTYLFVPRDNPLAQKDRLEVRDLDGQPFVTFGKRDHLHRFFMDVCSEMGVQPNIIMTSSNLDVCVSNAHQHHALMFGLPPDIYPADDPAYQLLPATLRTNTTFGTYLVKRKGDTLSCAARAFWNYLEER